MDKKKAVSILIRAAEAYAAEVCGINLLFIAKGRQRGETLEVAFNSYNFAHLT